jgi:hypothetical protein
VNPRKLEAYNVLLRMAKVDELRAQAALAAAVEEEAAAQRKVDAVELARNAVATAGSACISANGSMDLARYELVTRLDAALCERLRAATGERDDAAAQRMQRASENVGAKRYREKVGERLEDTRETLMRDRVSKTQEEATELWLESREEGV